MPIRKLLCIILFCLFTTTGWSVTYTVDGTNGTDAGTCVGATPSTECKTIQYVFDNEDLDPNDIVEIEEGTYSEDINPGADDVGTDGNQLIIRGKAGHTVIVGNVATPLDLSGGEDYITVKNLTFSNPSNRWGYLVGVVGFVGEDLTFTGLPAGGPTEYGVFQTDEGSYHKYTNCSWDGSGVSEDSDTQNDLVNIRSTDHVVFDGCTFLHISHSLIYTGSGDNNSDYIIIRNSTFSNKWRHGLSACSQYMLIENNTFYGMGERNTYCPWDGDRNRLNPAMYVLSGEYTIFRKNKMYDNDIALHWTGGADTLMTYNLIYNNTIYDTNAKTTNDWSGILWYAQVDNDETFSHLYIINNIFYKTDSDAYGKEFLLETYTTGTLENNLIKNNIFADPILTLNGKWDKTTDTITNLENNDSDWVDGSNILTDPQMNAPDSQDFTAASGSSTMVDAGTFLTETNGAAPGGSSATLTIDNAYFFFDGYGISGETADYIYIVGDGTPANVLVQIVSVDSATQITLASPQNWDDNADVYLAYSSTVGLIGTAPDIGAYEYQSLLKKKISVGARIDLGGTLVIE